ACWPLILRAIHSNTANRRPKSWALIPCPYVRFGGATRAHRAGHTQPPTRTRQRHRCPAGTRNTNAHPRTTRCPRPGPRPAHDPESQPLLAGLDRHISALSLRVGGCSPLVVLHLVGNSQVVRHPLRLTTTDPFADEFRADLEPGEIPFLVCVVGLRWLKTVHVTHDATATIGHDQP